MQVRKIALTLAMMTVIALSAGLGLAQDRKPSTPEQRAQAVRMTRALETDPLNKDAKKAREWLIFWLIQAPDITVTVCTDYLTPLYEKDKNREKNYAPEIATQMMFSSAAFIIEHPDQANDAIDVNKAGLEGSLKAYESISKTKPNVKWPFLDELIGRRDKGTLEEYVREISTTKCKGSK